MEQPRPATSPESPDAAVAALIAHAIPASAASRAPSQVERIPLRLARGRILAEPITADRDSPAFDHAAMDGYALRAADLAPHAGPLRVPVIGEARIGHEPPALPVGSGPAAARISTGAPIPPWSDAVIPVERISEHDTSSSPGPASDPPTITLTPEVCAAVRPGDHVRRRAENARRGEILVDPGTVLSAASIGVLAAVGAAHPAVVLPLRITLLSTGDEVLSGDHPPDPFQIRDSNGPTIAAALGSVSWAKVVHAAHIPDDSDRLSAELARAASESDAIILTGGVSKGHRDHVRAAVLSIGAQIVFHGLPQRPGKPMLGAMAPRAAPSEPTAALPAIPVLGLPGNPVSALVTCTRIVIPVLAACAGAAGIPPRPRITVSNPDGRTLGLWWHRLARLDEHGCARLIDARGSGDLIAAGRADGFVELPPGIDLQREPHTPVAFFPWPS